MCARQDAAGELVALLSARQQTVATCESLTAGLCAATLASVPGASAVLRGGLITYATELKYQLAGVAEGTDPITAECASAMAEGARRACTSTWAIALTGVAGPTMQGQHPVGEVFVAVAGPTATAGTKVVQLQLHGDRDEIREQAVQEAFRVLREQIQGIDR